MNDLLFTYGLAQLKPLLALLLLPPVPLLLLVVIGGRQLARQRRASGWLLLGLGTAGLWLSATAGLGDVLKRSVLQVPPALGSLQIEALRREARVQPGAGAAGTGGTAIVVLGAGRRLLAPEYGLSTLTPMSIERLRYGLWLGRETGLPLAFSGGVGPGAPEGASEAEIAGRIAAREFGRPLRWTEEGSRDTRENALRTVALLQPQGITRIVLVTHDFHMRRALRNFERAAGHAGMQLTLQPAPLGLSPPGPWQLGDWLPSGHGAQHTWFVLREMLGLVAGA